MLILSLQNEPGPEEPLQPPSARYAAAVGACNRPLIKLRVTLHLSQPCQVPSKLHVHMTCRQVADVLDGSVSVLMAIKRCLQCIAQCNLR